MDWLLSLLEVSAFLAVVASVIVSWMLIQDRLRQKAAKKRQEVQRLEQMKVTPVCETCGEAPCRCRYIQAQTIMKEGGVIKETKETAYLESGYCYWSDRYTRTPDRPYQTTVRVYCLRGLFVRHEGYAQEGCPRVYEDVAMLNSLREELPQLLIEAGRLEEDLATRLPMVIETATRERLSVVAKRIEALRKALPDE